MMTLFESARLLSALSFLGYGLTCFFSSRMVSEFNRYGFGRQRLVVGVLQIAGSLGLLIGFYNLPLTMVSSLGFALMMFLAVLVRIKIRDPVIAAIPAVLFFAINFYIFVTSLKLLTSQ